MRGMDLDECRITEGFFAARQELNATVTMESVYDRFFETGRINALKCDPALVKSHIYWDSDVAKWVEAAAYVLHSREDAALRSKMDAIIDDIVRNQKETGYFNSYFQVWEPDAVFTRRWDHELYCAGHLFEAAVALSRYLGDDRLLRFAEKYVDHITERFVEKRDTGFTTPGHEEIELALLRLNALTGEEKYLRLAEFFLNQRGVAGNEEKIYYMQSHLPIREQTEATGHAVRALYLYTAMAELALRTDDKPLVEALRKLASDVIDRKMYVTGSVGSSYAGEKFTIPYDLPNALSYSETCASIALIFFCDRMLRLTGEKVFGDVAERVLFNGVLAGVSLDGTSFFYVNPLEVNADKVRFNEALPKSRDHQPLLRRVKVFSCSCCPPNICRFFAELPTYIWYIEGNTVLLSQYISSHLETGTVTADLVSDFPYSGKIRLCVDSKGKPITLRLRKPEWCRVSFDNEEDGYLIYRGIFAGEEIALDFGMEPRRIYADPRIFDDAGKVAFAYGPLILCAEGTDNGGTLPGVFAEADAPISVSVRPGDPAVLTATVAGSRAIPGDSLYSDRRPASERIELRLIPYFAWANRDPSDMKIWFPEIRV